LIINHLLLLGIKNIKLSVEL